MRTEEKSRRRDGAHYRLQDNAGSAWVDVSVSRRPGNEQKTGGAENDPNHHALPPRDYIRSAERE